MPKSHSLIWPSPSISRFCGLMSRWTMPRWWAATSAAAVWRPTNTVSCTVRHDCGLPSRSRKQVGHRAALGVLHHQRRAVGVVDQFDRPDHVGMAAERHQRRQLTPCAVPGERRVGHVAQHLDGDGRAGRRLDGTVHIAEPTPADADEGVVAGDRRISHRPLPRRRRRTSTLGIEQCQVVAADHPHRQRVLDEPGAAVRRQLSRRAVQPADALRGELLADVVELAVDAGQTPAQSPGHLLIGGQGGRRPPVAAQRRLGDRHDQPQLVGGHGDTADRGVAAARRARTARSRQTRTPGRACGSRTRTWSARR